jgi:hypothetical protein
MHESLRIEMMNLAQDSVQIEALRVRIAEMNEFELMRCARTSAILNAVLPNESSHCQLEEARREWRRRHEMRERSSSDRV